MNSLRKQGLTELAAWFLEAAGPLNVLGAQVLYLGQPFVSNPVNDRLRALAHLLEEEDEARAFIAQLKGNPQ
jgi:demethoxyubiquinone hydroxylase (CLK1/Coq7/Cat5 family)